LVLVVNHVRAFVVSIVADRTEPELAVVHLDDPMMCPIQDIIVPIHYICTSSSLR
jgi:hypothetical protein